MGGKQGATPSGPCVHVTFPTWAGQLLAHPSGGAEERGGRGRTGKQAPGQFPHGGMGGKVQGLGAREETAARSKWGNTPLQSKLNNAGRQCCPGGGGEPAGASGNAGSGATVRAPKYIFAQGSISPKTSPG